MDLVVEELEGVVVLNVANVCTSQEIDCRLCTDIGGAVHNWLLSADLNYVVIDLQDEKDICQTFLIELLQLRKRQKIPFLFAGVMKRPKDILQAYNYSFDGTPIFVSPEEAVKYLKRDALRPLTVDFTQIRFGEPIMTLRNRQALNKFGDPEEPVDAGEL